jgi:hypothetical protein
MSNYYDPTCRPWYDLQKNNPNSMNNNFKVKYSLIGSTFGDIYLWANNVLGFTHCVPLVNESFYGAFCADIKPTS